jgi:hypothetical protein
VLLTSWFMCLSGKRLNVFPFVSGRIIFKYPLCTIDGCKILRQANSLILVPVLHVFGVKSLYIFIFNVNLLLLYLNIISITAIFALNIAKIQLRMLQYFHSITSLVKVNPC